MITGVVFLMFSLLDIFKMIHFDGKVLFKFLIKFHDFRKVQGGYQNPAGVRDKTA